MAILPAGVPRKVRLFIVNLIVFKGDNVSSLCPPSQAVLERPNERGGFPLWEAIRLDVRRQHSANAVQGSPDVRQASDRIYLVFGRSDQKALRNFRAL
jgi:hypothetical protein